MNTNWRLSLNPPSRMNGANGIAFPTIVASGGNATTLHYTTNDCRIEDETLVLIDAGAEYGRYLG